MALPPRNTRLLVVDDSPETRYVYRHYLRSAGREFDLTEAETANQALELVRAQTFDCVLLDFCLPDADGIVVLEELSRMEHRSAVVMITGYGDESIAVDAMKLGAMDYLPKDSITSRTLIAAIDGALDRSRSKQDESRYRKELERQSVTDPLTGLYNRRYLFEQLAAELNRSLRYEQPMCLLLIDIDHFKCVNDKHGHVVGDRVIQAFAQMLQGAIRGSDHVARYGGEEFCIILTNTDLPGARVFAERTCAVAREFQHHDSTGAIFPATCSIGVAQVGPDTTDTESLIQAADEALYRAKNNGRDQVCVSEGRRAVAARS